MFKSVYAKGELQWVDRVNRVVVVAACALVALSYAPFFSDYMVTKRVLLLVSCALIAGLWLLRCALQGALILPGARWLLPWLAFVFLSALSLMQAANVYMGIEHLGRQIGLGIIALSVALVFYQRVPWSVLIGVAATATIASALGVLQFAGIHAIPMPHTRFGNLGISTFGNLNFVAHYLEIAIVLMLGAALACRVVWQRIALWSCTLFCGYYMLLTESRGGWIALACGLVFFAWQARRQVVGRVPWKGVLAVLILLAVIGEFSLRAMHSGEGLSHLAERVVTRLETLADAKHISIDQRRLVWLDTVDLIEDNFWSGVGVGNYAVAVPDYRTVKRHREWQQYINLLPHRPYYAHNEYLEIWAESGVGALIAWLLTIAIVCFSGWRAALRQDNAEKRIVLWSLLAALLATLVHSLFSLNLRDPTAALHFWVAVGLIEAVRGAPQRTWALVAWQRVGCVVAAALLCAGGLYWSVGTLLGDYYYFRGQKKYYDVWQPNRAYLAFGRAVSWRASEFRHQHMLGLMALRIGRLSEAETALRRSLELHPSNAGALRLLGEALYLRGLAAESVEVLQHAVRLEPLHADAYAWLARSLQAQARLESDRASVAALHERSLEAWRQALGMAPENDGYLVGLGLGLANAGQYDEAIEVLQRAAQVHADDGVVLGNLGAIYLRQKRMERAEELLERATQLDPQRAEWWGNLALLYDEKGQLAEAANAMAKAAERAPDNAAWHVRLVSILLRQQRFEEALQHAAQGLRHHPNNEKLTEVVQDITRRVQKGER